MATKKTEAEASTEAKTPGASLPPLTSRSRAAKAVAARCQGCEARPPRPTSHALPRLTSPLLPRRAPPKAPKKQAPAEGAGGTLRLHHLRPAPGAHTAKTRVGRGEGSKGKTAGRGTKGTKARYQVPERFEGGGMPLHMRLPKLRGFKNPFRTEYQVVNIERLEALYPKGGTVTVEDLVAKGAVRKGDPVKVLGNGDLSVKLDVSVQAVSVSAKEKIVAAGGSVRD